MSRHTNIILLFALGFTVPSIAAAADFDFPAPAAGASQAFKITQYHVYPAKPDANGLPLLGTDNRPISEPIDLKGYCKGAIEGTIKLTRADGSAQTFSFEDGRGAVQPACRFLDIRRWKRFSRSRYRLARGEFGDGVRDYRLVPYRTVATDPRKVPTGSVVFIPSARGVVVRTAEGTQFTHDGYFFAADVGGVVEGKHLDLFTGTDLANTLPAVIRGDSGKVPIRIVDDPVIRQRLDALHRLP